MNKLVFYLFVFSLGQDIWAATWKKVNSNITSVIVPESTQCPSGYIGVSALPPYTHRYFCVAKYEMKNDGYGTAVSTAVGVPWVNIDRTTARSKCQNLGSGYDMISNDQWQTIARDIAGVAGNWSTGTVTSGELNRGHSDNVPSSALIANTNDNDPCDQTGEVCDSATWNSQRRTHTLSNGNKIWDFGGNVYEWVTNNNSVANGADGFISTRSGADIRQTRYGAAAFCATPSSMPYCGMGYGYFNYSAGAILRGGHFNLAENAGVFTADLNYASTYVSTVIGFRCVFVP